MHLQSITLLLSATAVSASALPGTVDMIQARETANSTIGTTPRGADFACPHSDKIVANQLAEMAKLKSQNIAIPPFLSGYYSAVNSGIEEIGCPGAPISLDKRSGAANFTANREPCDVTNDQHERMMGLINKFDSNKISIAPYLAGFLAATVDLHAVLLCPPFSGPATETAVAAKYTGDAASNSSLSNTSSG